MTRWALVIVLLGFVCACGANRDPESEREPQPADIVRTAEALSSIDCSEHSDTGYTNGNAFTISVVTVDGKPVEVATANAYYVMAQAADAAGITLQVVSGFRTMAEQEYLYACYVNCNCNSCNLAAKPGYSNHQSGHALDLNTSAPGVYDWLAANGAAFGFSRTVPSEAWHWEWWGGGPGGGPCGMTAENCQSSQASACGNYGCACADGQCSGGFCPGTGCTAQSVSNCGAYGCQCVDGQCNGGFCPGSGCTAKEVTDCGKFGCQCVDHQCNGGFCPGTGCTAKETNDCGAYGCGCIDHKCNGGYSCPGSGCTAKQDLDCKNAGETCSNGKCVGSGSGGGGGSAGAAGAESGGASGAESGGSSAVDGGSVAKGGSGGAPWGSGGAFQTSGGKSQTHGSPPKSEPESVDGSAACSMGSSSVPSGGAFWFVLLFGCATLRKRGVSLEHH